MMPPRSYRSTEKTHGHPRRQHRRRTQAAITTLWITGRNTVEEQQTQSPTVLLSSAVGSCVPPVTSQMDPVAVPSLLRSSCAQASACQRIFCQTPSSVVSGGGAVPRTTAAFQLTHGHGESSCSVLTATLGLTKSAWWPPASASALDPTTTSQWPRTSRGHNATRSIVVCLRIEARTTHRWWVTRTEAALHRSLKDRDQSTLIHKHHTLTYLLKMWRRCKSKIQRELIHKLIVGLI